MSDRSHVYSSCFWRQSVESACGSPVTSRPASITEWTSKSVPYASKRKALGLATGPPCFSGRVGGLSTERDGRQQRRRAGGGPAVVVWAAAALGDAAHRAARCRTRRSRSAGAAG